MVNEPNRRSDGFLERGDQVTRLEAFVDAAFAFAVTVLVLKVFRTTDATTQRTPEFQDVMAAFAGVPGFLVSFALVAMFWWAHQTWSRRYGLDDGRSILLSLLLVATVGIFVFPLHFMFQCAIGWFTRIALPPEWQLPFVVQLTEVDELRSMYLIYAIAWSALGGIIVGLYHNAWRHREELQLDLGERVATQGELVRWMLVPATGAVSALLAVTLPFTQYWMAGLPGIVYAGMSFTGIAMKRRMAAVRPAIEAELLP